MTAVALLVMTAAGAQTIKDDVAASKLRAAELKTLMENQPKECGDADIDDYAKSVNAAALLAIANSEKLSNFYYRQIGQTEDGVTDVTVVKPELKDWTELGVGVGGEAVALKKAQESGERAAKRMQALSEEAKQGNPMAKAKKAKQVKAATAIIAYGKDALPVLAKESIESVKAVKQIIETVKSGKNL